MATSASVSTSAARRAGLIREAIEAAAFDIEDAAGLANQIACHATSPHTMADLLRCKLEAERVIVAGALDQRLLFLGRDERSWTLLSMAAEPLGQVRWPAFLADELRIAEPAHYLSRIELSERGVHLLTRPRVALVALYHPEVFPLPRFPLGISDLARSIRQGLMGEVRLFDMQLTPDVGDIVLAIQDYSPDITGVSATFGQYDVLIDLLDRLDEPGRQMPLTVFGGSLSALNQEAILDRFPKSVVAHGPGELSMRDLAAYWHGDLGLGHVRGISHRGAGTIAVNRRIDNRTYTDILPELDLIRPTLDHNGVMQLESSRGCTHACSFCPRKHKGVWSGDDPGSIEAILPDLVDVYADYPNLARKIYLVDEEFIGHDLGGPESVRVEAVARRLHDAGFQWETSARVDQVYRPDRDREWHVRRMRVWRTLRSLGLDRCLFGVESGVDSILRRFNKHTTSAQNVMAVRMLTACDIPIRCTYITFDQLMSLDELVESHEFQGRRDLLMRPVLDMPLGQLYEALHDDGFVRQHSTGDPFYVSISYMLVSMECLLKSPYLKLVEAAGLADETLPSIGRRNARFREPAIGLLSQWAQRWVDRNFSFDYTLKSLEKITAGEEKAGLRRLRVLVKQSAYDLLGRMLTLACGGARVDDPALRKELDTRFRHLVSAVDLQLSGVLDVLCHGRDDILANEYQRWSARSSWELINGPDQCL